VIKIPEGDPLQTIIKRDRISRYAHHKQWPCSVPLLIRRRWPEVIFATGSRGTLPTREQVCIAQHSINRTFSDACYLRVNHHPGQFPVADLWIAEGKVTDRCAFLGQHFVHSTRLAGAIFQALAPLCSFSDFGTKG
jgi:hypothetical protein